MRLLLSVLFSVCLLATTPLRAQQVIESIDAATVVRLLAEQGFPGAEIDADGDVVAKMQGYRVLFLVGTYEGKSVQARFAISGTKAGMEQVNQFNRDVRFATAYLDTDGDPAMSVDLDLEGGVAIGRVKDFFRAVNELMVRFLRVVL
jgi:hypothetical protein